MPSPQRSSRVVIPFGGRSELQRAGLVFAALRFGIGSVGITIF
jgi:hypothetical protein